jgi:hypothetical protein
MAYRSGEKQMKIDPATCDKNCERCPKAKDCDGIALTAEQQFAVNVCGYFILAMAFLIAASFICGALK